MLSEWQGPGVHLPRLHFAHRFSLLQGGAQLEPLSEIRGALQPLPVGQTATLVSWSCCEISAVGNPGQVWQPPVWSIVAPVSEEASGRVQPWGAIQEQHELSRIRLALP